MRLLYVAATLDPAEGGVVEAIRSLGLAQQALGHTVEVATLDASEAAWLATFPLPVHALGPGKGTYAYRRDFPARLRALAGGFAAVIVNGLWRYPTYATWQALRGGPTPWYLFPHGMLDPWFRRAYPLRHLKKLLYWLAIERRVVRDAHALLFTAEEERRLAARSFPFYQPRAEKVVGLGIASPALDRERQWDVFYERFPELRGRRLLLFLGRLHDKKGCDLLVRAFAREHAPNTTLMLAGPPASAEYLRHLQTLAGDAPVLFPGMLAGDMKWGAFLAAEAFLLPSHQENFGLAVAEALATACPVLLSRQVNIWREIESDGAGWAESDDLAGTTRLLQRWEALPLIARLEMGERARLCFKTRFEATIAARHLLEALSP